MRKWMLASGALAVVVLITTFWGCVSKPGEKIDRRIEGFGITGSETRTYTRHPDIYYELPGGPNAWTLCESFTTRGIPVCVYCPLPGAPVSLPEGCKLVDLKCNGGPFEVWCGDLTGDLVAGPAPAYSVPYLEFVDAVGPTLHDDGQVVLRLQVSQAETFPSTELRGPISITTPSSGSIAYEPGVQIPAGCVIELSGMASDLAFNLFYLGFDRLAWADEDGEWEIVTLKYLCEEAGEPVIDLPYVFLIFDGQIYSTPYDVRTE